MKNIFVVAALMAAQVISSVALAKGDGGTVFGLSIGKYDQKSESGGSETSTKRTSLDLNLNFDLGGVYVGGQYGTLSDDITGSQMGPTLGYRKNGFFIQATYFLSGELKDSSSNELKKGTGLGLDLGYNAMLGNSFFLGFQFSQKSITYKEFTSSSGTTTETDTKYTTLQPMVNLGFMF